MMNENMLYHYTDFKALSGILSDTELRLNNILNMNDAAEMKFFMKKICGAVAGKLRSTGNEEAAVRAEKAFEKELKNEFIYSAYAACFSKCRDDAAQWERYGNLGRGVCIGVDEEHLQKMAVGALSLQEVFYQDDLTGHPMVEDFAKMFDRGEDMPEKRQRLFNEAWIESVAFKHPSFSCEDEMRLVVSPFECQYFDIRPAFHITEERIKKYYPLNLKAMCAHAGCRIEEVIKEIIIGPESSQSLPILQDYISSLGYMYLPQKITLSECPLRRVLR